MNNVIDRYGRLEKIMGDGLMALFGEYTNNKAEMCGKALLCAKEIVEEFIKYRANWMKNPKDGLNIEQFGKLHNESLDLEIGIGL